MSADDISKIVETELTKLSSPEIADAIRPLLVPPKHHLRLFEYSPTHERFECWTILEHPPSDTGIAFSNFGFGPKLPWGLIGLSPGHDHYGMDSGWFTSLEDAFCDTWASDNLRIWNLIEEHADGKINVLASRLTGSEAMARLAPLQLQLPDKPDAKPFLEAFFAWPKYRTITEKDLRAERDSSTNRVAMP
jgi:hypothetical protein